MSYTVTGTKLYVSLTSQLRVKGKQNIYNIHYVNPDITNIGIDLRLRATKYYR